MRQRHRVRVPQLRLALMAAAAALLVSANAFSSGFQVMTHGARATGMGLAYAGIAGDPTAIFYNPAGIGWMKHVEGYVGVNFLTRTEGELAGAAPFPGSGALETMENNWYFFPDGYLVLPLTNELNVGVGGFAQYGLGLKWDNPNTTFTGQFISQNAVIQSLDTNLNFSYLLFPQLSIAAGVDYRFSKVQLERNQAAINPFNGAVVPVAHVKLNSDLLSNGGWGWNVGLMFKPAESISIGAAYRSKIDIDYEGEATFTQRPTGNAALDAIVAASLPPGNPPVRDFDRLPLEPQPRRRHRARQPVAPGARGGLDGMVPLREPRHHLPDPPGPRHSPPGALGRQLGLSGGPREGIRRLGGPHRLLLRQHPAARLRREPAPARFGSQRVHGGLRLQHGALGIRPGGPAPQVQGARHPSPDSADRQLFRHLQGDRPRRDGRAPSETLRRRKP